MAHEGYARGENALGAVYLGVPGVPRNYVKAVYWFRKSADQGDASAEDNLSNCYSRVKGVPRNYAKSVYWAHKAVVQKPDCI